VRIAVCSPPCVGVGLSIAFVDMLLYVGIYLYMPTIRSAKFPALPRGQGVFRPRDVAGQGISRTRIQRLAKSGAIERVGRGLYVPAGTRLTEHHTLAEAVKRVPRGVVCLLSALGFHRLTTQSPHEVWLAIDVKARKPHTDWPPLRIVRFSGAARTFGVEVHVIEGVEARITSRAKTVADCFKYRNKIGVDVAVEALREYLGKRGRSVDELQRAADACRVGRIIRPYIEALA
jgi:predicted transcriptional regulator of viral defense system